MLVRRGLPTLNTFPWNSPEMCYPILPNTYHPTRSENIEPTHPLPLSDCYIDMTWPFLEFTCCRIPTTPRDYTPVLPVSSAQLSRLRRLFSREVARVEDLEERLKQGDLEVIAAVPLPPSPVSAAKVPLPDSPIATPASSLKARGDSHDSRSDLAGAMTGQVARDEVSIIASDDSDSLASGQDDSAELGSEAADNQLFEMLRFENMINYTGDPRDPVAHVSYDLDEVDEVTDPLLFIEVRDRIRRYVWSPPFESQD